VKLQRQELKKARIEIIPMIDTIFFLLVFFMLTSLQTVQMSAPKVHLPGSKTANVQPKDKIVVTVDDQNRYFVDRQMVPFDQILPQLTAAAKANPNITVILNADKDDQTEQLLKIMDIAKQANPGQLVMATAPNGQGGL
jgi:biopolymer transport protein ExbD